MRSFKGAALKRYSVASSESSKVTPPRQLTGGKPVLAEIIFSKFIETVETYNEAVYKICLVAGIETVLTDVTGLCKTVLTAVFRFLKEQIISPRNNKIVLFTKSRCSGILNAAGRRLRESVQNHVPPKGQKLSGKRTAAGRLSGKRFSHPRSNPIYGRIFQVKRQSSKITEVLSCICLC